MLSTFNDENCQKIAKAVPLYRDFGFYYQQKFKILNEGDDNYSVLDDHRTFIKQLCHYILLLSLDKQPYYVIGKYGNELTMWF
jgi:hypothetical protein